MPSRRHQKHPSHREYGNALTLIELSKDTATGLDMRLKKAKCKFCKGEKGVFTCTRGNTSNLWSYLEKNHYSEYAKIAPSSLQQSRISRISTKKTPHNQPTISSALRAATPYTTKSREHKLRTDAVLDYITSDGRPLSTVDSTKFIQMSKVFDNRYKLPSRRSITDTCLPEKFITVRTGIQRKLAENKNSLVSIFSFTTDLWSSSTLEPYISLTAHYITNGMKMQRYTLETKYIPDRHTGVNLSHAIEELLELWTLDFKHVAAITTDSAANMLKMADVSGLMRKPCFGHLLHNGVNKALEEPLVKQLIAKLKRISAYFHQSHSRALKLEQEQKAAGKAERLPHAPCPTRWGSTYDMLRDINENLTLIKRIIVEDNSTLVPTPDEEKILKRVVEAFAE